MKVVLLQHLSGEKVYAVGEEITVSDLEAANMIEKGIAKCKTVKEHKSFVEKVAGIKKADEDRKAEAKSILEKEKIETELNGLYTEVVLTEAALNGVVLEDEQVLEMVEELRKRILPKDKG